MDMNRLTEKAREALEAAQSQALRHGQQHIDVPHLLVSLLEQEQGLAPAILQKADVDIGRLRRRAEQELEKLPRVSGAAGEADRFSITRQLSQVLAKAEAKARDMGDEYVSVEHLLLALSEEAGPVKRLFEEAGVGRSQLEKAMQEVRGASA